MNKAKIAGLLILMGLLLIGVAVCNITGWFVGNAVEVAKEEFSPRALLQKYEWFKNTAASLDKKTADVSVYQSRLTAMQETKPWDRTDKENFYNWTSEVAGVKASYNQLASEYNAQMAKFNWRFCNAGTLPQGATEVLPREFRTYITN